MHLSGLIFVNYDIDIDIYDIYDNYDNYDIDSLKSYSNKLLYT